MDLGEAGARRRIGNADEMVASRALNLPARVAGVADAEPLLLQGYEGLVQRQSSMPPILNAPRHVTESLERPVQLYDAWGKPAPAAEWKQKLAEFQQANKAVDTKVVKP